jgi:predicted ATPase/DNA-binding CsgD family transcriptional regulator
MVGHNLPAQLTPFVGRIDALHDIASLLSDSTCRLLTLIGPGGIGKTRLALETASQLAQNPSNSFKDGVYFASLQALNSPEFLVPTLAEAVNFQFFSSDEPQQQLLRYLSDKSMLIVVDNFEHLLDGAPLISDILAAAPGIKALVTSREALSLQEEWLYPVHGLSYPDNAEDIVSYDAVQLFTQNAQRVRLDFSLADETAGILRICRLVEGMPLALELAAAWVRALSCSEIADEIKDGLDILETTVRNVPSRHRNMRVVLEHSWALLSDTQQKVFRQLSVFRGGFTRDAAEVVADASARTLSALVDKPWLRWDAAHRRYDIHELLRQYGEEHASGDAEEWEQANERHCAYYASFLEQRTEPLKSTGEKEALEEIEVELENIRACWDWAVSHQKEAEIEMALESLWLFYDTGSRFQEGEQAFARAASALRANATNPTTCLLLGKVLARQGALCFSLAILDTARSLLQECLAILPPGDAPETVAFSLIELGQVFCSQGRFVEAKGIFQQSLALYRELNDLWGIAYALRSLSYIHRDEATEGSLEQANHHAQESLALFQELQYQRGIADLYGAIGTIMNSMGDYAKSEPYYSESLRLFQALDIKWGVAMSLLRMGRTAYGLGDDAEARRYALWGLEFVCQYHLGWHDLNFVMLIADMEISRGKLEWAYELLALSECQRQKLGASRDNPDFRLLGKLDEELLPNLAAAVERGRNRNFDTTLREVIAALRQEFQDTGQTLPPANQSLADPLTARELEILQLMADGLSNREIAEQLFLTVGTVKYYANQIYSKLHVGNRNQAATRARELSLISERYNRRTTR